MRLVAVVQLGAAGGVVGKHDERVGSVQTNADQINLFGLLHKVIVEAEGRVCQHSGKRKKRKGDSSAKFFEKRLTERAVSVNFRGILRWRFTNALPVKSAGARNLKSRDKNALLWMRKRAAVCEGTISKYGTMLSIQRRDFSGSAKVPYVQLRTQVTRKVQS